MDNSRLNEMRRDAIYNNRKAVTMDTSRLNIIRDAVHYWYGQQFAQVNGLGMNISQNDAGEDVFTGMYDYEVDVHLRGIMTDTTYTVIDDDTDEEICFGIDSVDHMRYDHLSTVIERDKKTKNAQDFKSEKLDECLRYLHLARIPEKGEKTKNIPCFKSIMLDDLHMEFIDDITEPDYDVYEKYFKLLPDGTYEFIGG